MTKTRWLILLFWVVVIGMILKQCHDSDAKQQQEFQAHPAQTHFFFTPPPKPPAAPLPPKQDADVQQTSFTVQDDTPGPGSFTCQVTVQNKGLSKAQSVQVQVRPFFGAHRDDEGGRINDTRINGMDPIVQTNTWVSFPDLNPGESSTQTATFLDQPHIHPGFNSQPQIKFETAK
jgi:hypothetical protein